MKFIVIFFASTLFTFNAIAADFEIAPGESAEFAGPASIAVKEEPPVSGAANADKELSNNKLLIESMVFISVLDSGYARGTMFSEEFVVSGDEPRSLDAQVSGNVSWNGILTIPGVNLESYSRISINAYLYDLTDDRVVGTVGVLREQCNGKLSPTEPCIKQYRSSKDIAFSAKVVMGHEYELRLSAQCTTGSGPAGQNVLCSFHDSSFEDIDGYIKWNHFTVTVAPDLVGMIEELGEDHVVLGSGITMLMNGHKFLAAGQDELKAGQDELKAAQEALKANQEQIIQLLITPEGQRPGWNTKDK